MKRLFVLISTVFSVFGLCMLLVHAAPALAVCDVGDSPGCDCFNNTGDWDAGGSPFTGDYIQEVALDTVGTRESCNAVIDPDEPGGANSGKPYYSIVLGSYSEADALAWAAMEAAGMEPVEDRQAWCSETISYWHREAGIPYAMGYGKRPVWNWLQKTVSDLRTWYVLEETLDDGRGRWIDARNLDYNDFKPGVNAPLPGAYMGWAGCRYINTMAPVSGWYNEAEYYKVNQVGHSLMIDEMWVHRDIEGNVFKVEVSFLEGNSGNQVRGPGNNQRIWDDLIAYTPQGSQTIYWNNGDDETPNTSDDIRVKVYGFGIDLDESGDPIYDASRLHYIDYYFYVRRIFTDLLTINDDTWNTEYVRRIKPLKNLFAVLDKNNGPDIACSSQQVTLGDMPNGDDSSWIFPQGVKDDVKIEIDYLAPNPLPLEALRMDWSPDFIPQSVLVQVKDEDGKVHETKISDFSKYTPLKTQKSVPMVARLAKPVNDMCVIWLVFPKGTFDEGQAELFDISLSYHEGPYGDAETPETVPIFVDIRPGLCPNTLSDIDSDHIDIALLGSQTVDVRNILADKLLLNGQSLMIIDQAYKDVATQFIGSAPDCHTVGPDGHTDLVLSFKVKEFIATLKPDITMPFEVRVDGMIKRDSGDLPLVGQDFLDLTDENTSEIFGDINGDCDVDGEDLYLFRVGYPCPINTTDLGRFASEFGRLGCE